VESIVPVPPTNGGLVNESYGYGTNRMQLTTQTATKGGTSLMNLSYSYQASAGRWEPGQLPEMRAS
jgi:hypothetical protein